MSEDGFGSRLWKNMQAVRLGQHGGIEAPIRANGRDGIVIGVDAVREREAAAAAPPGPTTPGVLRELWCRMLRR